MILADKIVNERKKNGWSQEELASMLSVSRQSVSKWESAQAVPDLQKILKLADIFGVSTDYLLKEDMEPEPIQINDVKSESASETEAIRTVTMEEANAFLSIEKESGPKVANAVSLCILSPVLLIFLAGLSEFGIWGITEQLASLIGMTILLIMVATAVYIFIVTGSKRNPFTFLEKEAFETAYGVSGMVLEKKKAFESKYSGTIAFGVVLCILSPLPLIMVSLAEMPDYITTAMVCVLLGFVSAGVNLFIRVGTIQSSFEKLLQEKDYTVQQKKTNSKVEKVSENISGIYWLVVTAIYLTWSFYAKNWDISWIVWAIAGVLYGAVVLVVRLVVKED